MTGGLEQVSQAALYRENAHKIRRLVAGVSGSSLDEALNLAQEYEARAQELDRIGPGVGTGGLAERVAGLIGQRGAEIEAIRARELDYEIKLAAARVYRALLEARIAGIIEASGLISLPGVRGVDQPVGDPD